MTIAPKINNIFRLPVSLAIVEGELISSLRQLNSYGNSWTRIETIQKTIQYNLHHRESFHFGAGDAGSLSFWPVGDHTYMDQIPAPEPTNQQAVNYLFIHWNRKEKHSPGYSFAYTDKSYQIIKQILDHISERSNANLELIYQIDRSFLKDVCLSLQLVLTSILGYEIDEDLQKVENYRSMVAGLLGYWTHDLSWYYSNPTPGIVESLWEKLEFFLTEDKDLAQKRIKNLSLTDQLDYRFPEIQILLDDCRQSVYQIRKAYHDQVISIFLDQIKKYTENKQCSEIIPKVNTPTREVVRKPAWERIQERGNDRDILRLWHEKKSAKEISMVLNISDKRVYNVLSDLRRKYGKAFVPYKGSPPKKKPSTGSRSEVMGNLQ